MVYVFFNLYSFLIITLILKKKQKKQEKECGVDGDKIKDWTSKPKTNDDAHGDT